MMEAEDYMQDFTDLLDKLQSDENVDTEVEFNYRWTLHAASISGVVMGKCLTSPIFSINFFNNKLAWCIKLYPRGQNEESIGYVSVNLQLLSYIKNEVMTNIKFALLNGSGQESIMKNAKHRFVQQDEKGVNKLIEYSQFVHVNTLYSGLVHVNALYLSKNSFTISCTVTIASESVDKMQFNIPEFQLSDELGMLFENRKFSDVTLCVTDKEYQVHKAILAARSPVFAAMFEHEMKENKQNKVEIFDIDHEVLHEMLKFIYTGKADISEKIVDRLLAAADKYNLENLKLMCEQVLCNKLSTYNAAENLILADLYNVELLKMKAIDIISNRPTIVRHTPGWKSLIQHPHLIKQIKLK